MYYNYTNIYYFSSITVFQISDFSNSVDTSNLSTGSSTLSVIWSWRWLVAEIAADVSEDENIELKLEKEGLGDICSKIRTFVHIQ